MTLRLSPDLLAAAYEYHRAAPPFVNLGLPRARTGKVKFRVGKREDRFSELKGYCRSQEAEIIVSERLVGSTFTLMPSMAHEMIHLYQHIHKTETPNAQHNAEFRNLARLVCRHHGYDALAF